MGIIWFPQFDRVLGIRESDSALALSGGVFLTPTNVTDILANTGDALLASANVFTRGQTITQGTANESALTISGYSVTGANTTAGISLTGTWNTSGGPIGLFFDITNTSSTNSKIMQGNVGGSLVFDILPSGSIRGNNFVVLNGIIDLDGYSKSVIRTGGTDTGLIEFRGTVATGFRIYNAYTSASNYERAVIDWQTTANTLRIGTEAQTGTVRNINFVGGVVTFASGTATPANGSAAASIRLGTTAGLGIYYGSGAPTVSAAQGSWYLRTDGSSTSTRAYVNTDGTTGWTAITTAT